MMKHIDIRVADDEEEYKEYGSLYSFAEARLNAEIENMTLALTHGKINVCSVIEDWYKNQIRPVQCDSRTWYDRRTLELSVWVQIIT